MVVGEAQLCSVRFNDDIHNELVARACDGEFNAFSNLCDLYCHHGGTTIEWECVANKLGDVLQHIFWSACKPMILHYINHILRLVFLPLDYEFNLAKMAFDEYIRRICWRDELIEDAFRIVMTILSDRSIDVPLCTLRVYKHSIVEALQNNEGNVYETRTGEVSQIVDQIDRLLATSFSQSS